MEGFVGAGFLLTGWVFGESTFGSLQAEVVGSDGVFGRLKSFTQNLD